jgi:hypothetical protein
MANSPKTTQFPSASALIIIIIIALLILGIIIITTHQPLGDVIDRASYTKMTDEYKIVDSVVYLERTLFRNDAIELFNTKLVQLTKALPDPLKTIELNGKQNTNIQIKLNVITASISFAIIKPGGNSYNLYDDQPQPKGMQIIKMTPTAAANLIDLLNKLGYIALASDAIGEYNFII